MVEVEVVEVVDLVEEDTEDIKLPLLHFYLTHTHYTPEGYWQSVDHG